MVGAMEDAPSSQKSLTFSHMKQGMSKLAAPSFEHEAADALFHELFPEKGAPEGPDDIQLEPPSPLVDPRPGRRGRRRRGRLGRRRRSEADSGAGSREPIRAMLCRM